MPTSTRNPIHSIPRPPLPVVLSLGLVLTVAIGLLLTLSPRRITGAQENARGAHRTLADADRLLATMSEAEATARRYLLTGETSQLAGFKKTLLRYPQELARLHAGYLTRNNRDVDFLALRDSLVAHFTELQTALGSSENTLAALRLIESETIRRSRDQIHGSIRALQRVELTRMAENAAVVAERAESVHTLNAGLIALAVTFVGTGAWLLVRRMRDIEGLITVCAWTRQVQWHGRWISFEEYLAKRFHLRCTHGICEEAAEKLLIGESTDSAAPFPIKSTRALVQLKVES